MRFEFDPSKSDANRVKHGIDFAKAQRLWSDPARVVIPSAYAQEARKLCVGRIGNEHWTAIFTERGEALRMISVRRSRKSEKDIYEKR